MEHVHGVDEARPSRAARVALVASSSLCAQTASREGQAAIALLLAAVLVAALAGRGPRPVVPLLVLLSVPMGLQNAVIRRLGAPGMITTVLTMTLTGIAADSWLAGGESPRLARRSAAVVAMLVGELAGAVLLRRGVARTVGAAVVADAIALCGVLSARQGRQKPSESGCPRSAAQGDPMSSTFGRPS